MAETPSPVTIITDPLFYALAVPAVVALPVLLVAGAIGGALWAGVAALLRLRFGVLEVISTIMLNFVAQAITGWLVRGPLQEPTRVNPQSASLPTSLQLPVLLEVLVRVLPLLQLLQEALP